MLVRRGVFRGIAVGVVVAHRRHDGDTGTFEAIEEELLRLRRLRPAEREVEDLRTRRGDRVQRAQESRPVDIEVPLDRLIGKDLPHREPAARDPDDARLVVRASGDDPAHVGSVADDVGRAGALVVVRHHRAVEIRMRAVHTGVADRDRDVVRRRPI